MSMNNDGFAEGMLAGRGTYGGYGDGFGCGGMDGIFGIIALLALANGGFGGFGNGGYGNDIQTSILENSANQRENCMQFTSTNQNITNGNYQTQNLVTNGFAQVARDMCQQGTALAQTENNNTKEIMGMLYQMSRDNDKCCCETKQLVLEQGNRMEKMYADSENQRLRDEVANLRADMRMQGVVRYPDGFTYDAGDSPFCGHGRRNCNRGF